jgi:hypothetical protein
VIFFVEFFKQTSIIVKIKFNKKKTSGEREANMVAMCSVSDCNFLSLVFFLLQTKFRQKKNKKQKEILIVSRAFYSFSSVSFSS